MGVQGMKAAEQGVTQVELFKPSHWEHASPKDSASKVSTAITDFNSLLTRQLSMQKRLDKSFVKSAPGGAEPRSQNTDIGDQMRASKKDKLRSKEPFLEAHHQGQGPAGEATKEYSKEHIKESAREDSRQTVCVADGLSTNPSQGNGDEMKQAVDRLDKQAGAARDAATSVGAKRESRLKQEQRGGIGVGHLGGKLGEFSQGRIADELDRTAENDFEVMLAKTAAQTPGAETSGIEVLSKKSARSESLSAFESVTDTSTFAGTNPGEVDLTDASSGMTLVTQAQLSESVARSQVLGSNADTSSIFAGGQPLRTGFDGQSGPTGLSALAHSLAQSDPLSHISESPLDASFPMAFAQRICLLTEHGLTHAELRLNPSHLGPVQVKIQYDGGAVQVDFQASLDQTRQAIESSLGQLRELLQHQGLLLLDSQVRDVSANRVQASADIDFHDRSAQSFAQKDAQGQQQRSFASNHQERERLSEGLASSKTPAEAHNAALTANRHLRDLGAFGVGMRPVLGVDLFV